MTHLTFGIDFDQPVNPNCIPQSVTHLIFGHHFNQPINPNCIPQSVTHLIFGYCFNQPINPNCIPQNVTHLFFNVIFNQSLENINIETEINFHYNNENLPNDRIINIFKHFSDEKIQINFLTDTYNIGNEYCDKLDKYDIIKIKLIPKILSQQKVKSARKIIQ